MKLILNNFRKYESKEFEFPDNGITLISGDSNCGKSTIFKAIFFTLYGIQKGSNLRGDIITRGKKTCSTTLEYKNLKIIRTNGKTSLKVFIQLPNEERELLGEDAQQFIFSEFGKFFGFTSYIAQRNCESFLGISPAKRLELLQNFSGLEESFKIKEQFKTIHTTKKEEKGKIEAEN